MNAAQALKKQNAETVQRQEAARTAVIARDDLYLLMEVYNNMVESNTTILDRQDALHTNLERVMAEMVNMCSNQGRLLEEMQAGHKAAMDGHQQIKGTIIDLNTEILKGHHQLNVRIYASMVGMGVIVAALIGVLAKVI